MTDTDFCFKKDGKLPATPLFNDLIDAYNGFLVLNSLLCDYDTWDRGLAPHAKASVLKIDYFLNGMSKLAKAYKKVGTK